MRCQREALLQSGKCREERHLSESPGLKGCAVAGVVVETPVNLSLFGPRTALAEPRAREGWSACLSSSCMGLPAASAPAAADPALLSARLPCFLPTRQPLLLHVPFKTIGGTESRA